MKKITLLSLFGLLLTFIPTMAQNTASVSGNWDDCATWGNPTTTGIIQNETDTKTINTGINVVQNTAWSTKTVDFGTGNGSISFADNAKSIDFVADGGSDKSCTPPCTTAPILTGITVSATGGAYMNPGWTSDYTKIAFNLSGTNMGTTSWTITPSTGVSPASGSAKNSGYINFATKGTYVIKYTVAGTGSCTATSATMSKSITVVGNDNCDGIEQSWTPSGAASLSEHGCGFQMNSGNCGPAGALTKSFTTVPGQLYYVTFPDNQAGHAYTTDRYDVTSSTSSVLASNQWTGYSVQSFSFTANTTTTTVKVSAVANFCASTGILMNFQMYTIND